MESDTKGPQLERWWFPISQSTPAPQTGTTVVRWGYVLIEAEHQHSVLPYRLERPWLHSEAPDTLAGRQP